MHIFAIGTLGAFASAAGGLFSAIAGYFGWKALRQKRANAPDMVANVDAARDVNEAGKITNVIDTSDQAGKITDDERKAYGEN